MERQQRILQKHRYIYLSVLLFNSILVGDKQTTAYMRKTGVYTSTMPEDSSASYDVCAPVFLI